MNNFWRWPLFLSVVITKKQKPYLYYKGHSYIKDRSTSTKTYWCCVNYFKDECHSRLHTCIITNDIIKSAREHTCTIDGSLMETRKFNEEMVHRARYTQQSKDIIITNCYQDKTCSSWNINLIYLSISDQGIARLPVRDHIKKRRIPMVGQNKNIVHVQPANDRNFLSIPIPLTKTVHGDMFLHCDTGAGMFL